MFDVEVIAEDGAIEHWARREAVVVPGYGVVLDLPDGDAHRTRLWVRLPRPHVAQGRFDGASRGHTWSGEIEPVSRSSPVGGHDARRSTR